MTAAERLRGGIAFGALGRRLIRLAIVVAVLGALGTGIWWYFFKADSKPTQTAALTEVAVTKGRLVSTLATTGTAQSTLTSKLTFLGSGQVRTISVKVGDSVVAGQELARLDDRDAQRKVDTAKANLDSAQIRLNQLTEPATAADLAAAQQALASSKTSLATAQANLDKATRGPAAADVLAADSSVASADSALQNANNSVETAKNAVQTAINTESSSRGALLSAQRAYCQSNVITVYACTEADIPLSDQMSRDLQAWIQNPPSGSPAQVTAATQNASAFLTANGTYVSAKNAIGTAQTNVLQAQKSVETAQKSLDSARAKRQALFDPPTDTDLAQMQAAIASAQAGIVSAQARLDLLIHGAATANDIALQQQNVKLSQISYQTALDGLDNLVLRAPFDGLVGAIPINQGDQVGAATAAVTLSSPSSVRVDLTVGESDLINLKQGLFAIATFDALPGQTYLLKITAVSNAPTVTQGVTTFAVQGQILRGPDLVANAAELQKIGAALQSLAGGRTGGNAGGGAAGATRPAGQPSGNGQTGGQGQGAGRTPGAGGSPPAGVTPGAGGGGGGLVPAANQPLPTPGMNANVIVVINIQEDQLLLPTSAVRRQGRQAFVYVKGPDGKPLQKNITVSGTDATNTGIASGLAEGDMVLVGTVVAPGGATSAATPVPRATPAGGVR